jgi:predicted metal-binding protein
MNRQLFEAEKVLDGFACGFVGKCIYCSKTCARIEGKPCRHPDKVRPSLEAFGFDLMKTSEELLGIKMKWGHDGMMPEYLTLVCGVFYDKKTE